MHIDEHWPIDSPRGENQDFLLHLLQGMEFLAQGFTPYVHTGLPPRIGGLRYENPFHAKRVAKFHVFSLRLLVDSWIESGRDGMYEDPRKRHLPAPLMDALMQWSSSRPTELSFQSWNGAPSLYIPVARTDDPEHPFKNAWDTAVLLFARLLDSDYRYRIAKCRREGCTYYYSERIPRGPLKYGTYCQTHRQGASAQRSVERRRSDIKKDKIAFLQNRWGKWPPGNKSERSRLNWLHAELVEYQPNATVKVNWITRHLQEISGHNKAFSRGDNSNGNL